MKHLLTALAVALLWSCSDDDNSDQDCRTCYFEEVIVVTRVCDNEDGTVTISLNGESRTEDLEGLGFDEFIDQLETIGYSCDRIP